MPAAPLPPCEADRLAALRALAIMDSGPDPRFESFVRLAAAVYEVPVALVSLVDERRQWFKAGQFQGLSQTPREHAFCAHAILQPEEVLVVEDATSDPRFADSPLVTGDAGIRFYAGAVVNSPDGLPVGTLCLMDCAPRTLDHAGRKQLAELAEGVSALLELHSLAGRLSHAAHHDGLTGLANRARFDMALDLAVSNASHAEPCALLLLDLDRFKWVNDTLGHMAGDALLREVAKRLTASVRPGDLCARFGGDEFAVLLSEPAGRDVAEAIARRVDEALSAPMTLEGETYRPGASIGVALCPHDASAPGSLLRMADQALYARKRQARERKPGQELRRALKSAVSDRAMTVEWEPVFHAATGALHGHEALRRWLRPGKETAAPSILVPLAEADGLIGGIDALVLFAACEAAVRWPEPHILSFNVSADWFGSQDLLQFISQALSGTGLPAHRFMLELPVSAILAHESDAASRLAALHGLGVQVALDGFGGSQAGLGLLRDMPFDMVKLAPEMAAMLGASARADALMNGLVGLCHGLGITVAATGVETPAQLAALQRAGCDLVQGQMLGQPEISPKSGRPTKPALISH